ncbi:MAG: hypothetical protein K0R17_752 [Rariglobus sp.]|nr:hypothetical protein [Rariglobus sp.]
MSDSNNSKPKVYIHRIGPKYSLYMNEKNEADLSSFAEVVNDGPTVEERSRESIVARLQGCSAILSLAGGWSAEITGDVLKTVGTVKAICIAHWGEQFVEAAKEANVPLTEGSNANTVAVAEWTLTAATMGIRKLHTFDKAMKSGSQWGENRLDLGLVCESTIGLVGLGRIGAHCARMFTGLGAKVIAYDPYWTQEQADKAGATLVSMEELLRTADVISLHLPVTPQTTGMFGAKEFAKIKDGAVFINSARAALTDENALIVELKTKRFSAFLDVFAEEPAPMDHPFRSMENVVITPHFAGDNKAMLLRCGRQSVETLRIFFKGKGLKNYR